MIDSSQLSSFVGEFWDSEILPSLEAYIRIPNLSPDFDPNWDSAPHTKDVIALVTGWLKKHLPTKALLTVEKLAGKTPLIFVEIPGDVDKTVMLYGHLDKQPPMEGWFEGLSPYEPVLKEGKLYGRGGADDGYSVFLSLCALKALNSQGVKLPRTLLFLEFSEESGSPDLQAYLDHFANQISKPDLVVCLDAGVGNYEQFWLTNSVRGELSMTLRVDVLTGGVHSGVSGVVPSSFRILRDLLDRVEDVKTGEILIEALNTQIPNDCIDNAKLAANVLGEGVFKAYPFYEGVLPVTKDGAELILNRTWRPTLSCLGQDGLPKISEAGNVLRAHTALKLSFRLPPTVKGNDVEKALQNALLQNPPYNAKITLSFERAGDGWYGAVFTQRLKNLVNEASELYFKKPAMTLGVGGSIPFIGALANKFPDTEFVVTGVLGPKSNAHGPNEFLHIEYAKKLTGCVAHILSGFGE